MTENISLGLTRLFPNFKDINFGMILISTYILFDFGSFQGIFEIVNNLRLPYIVALLSVVYALYLVLNKRVDFNSATTKSMFILCFIIIAYSQISTKNLADKQANLTLFLQYLANYIILISCVKKPWQFIFIIDVWLFGILHSSYHAIYQGGKLWDSIWLKDENHISLICAYAIPFAFFLHLNYKSKLKKLFYIACLAFFVSSVVIASSRGGLVTMVVMGFLCWLFVKNKFRSFLLILITVILIFQFAPARFFEEAESLQQGTKEGTADERIYSWGLAFLMFKDHPMIGVGPYNYKEYFQLYDYEERFGAARGSKAFAKRVAHSTPVEFLAEFGIVGYIVLIALHISIYRNWKTIKKLKKLKNEDKVIKDDYILYETITHACAFTYLGFWIAATFLSLLPYPFLWILIPFSEAWKNITLNYVEQRNKVPSLT
ncbi:MAG: hypothetical protein DRI84_06460 [Bacteroidetes bacterium]|nr:MAG: hypothetical protein DRI84_06460 [Bacteroidota bacterium]